MSSHALGVLPNMPESTLDGSGDFVRALRILLPFLALTVVLLAVSPISLRLLFPVAACLVGYHIYKRNESYYLSFVLWIYMLTPLLRRVVDWRTAYQEQSMILLAPLLLTLLPAIHLRSRLAEVSPLVRTVALLTLSGIAFGAGVGMIKHPGMAVILAAATWSAPIVLCVFAASIRERWVLVRVLSRTLLWGVLIMSLYGVYQFMIAPPWDTYWLRQISNDSVAPSFGQPKPMAIRVWSTMNAPGALAVFLSTTLVWLGIGDGFFLVFVSVMGYITLALTLARAAWMQAVLALIIFACGCRRRTSLITSISMLLVGGLATYLFIHEVQFSGLSSRIQTLSSLGSDESAHERQAMYGYMNGLIVSTPLGVGLQSLVEVHGYPIDSSLILLFYMLGWMGASCYLFGFLYLLAHVASSLRSFSGAQVAAAAVTLACATQILTGDVLYRQGGIVFWLFAGIWASVSSRDPVPV
jgi:hypothetical protein